MNIRHAIKLRTVAALAVVIWGSLTSAATFTWNGAAGNGNWSTAANWAGGIAPTNDGTAAVVLAGTNQLTPNVDAAWDISSLTFSNSAGTFVLGGNLLTIRAGGITNSSTNLQTINNAITLRTNQAWNCTAGSLVFNGSISNGTNQLTLVGNFNSAISGVISGTGGLTKTGTGTNTLSGTNTYSGVTTVSAGVINLQNSAALGSTNAGVVVASGAALQLQGGISVGNKPLTLSGTGISASGALRSLTNNNAWAGPISLAAATTIGCDTNLLTLAGGIANSTNGISTNLLTFSAAGNIAVTGNIGSAPGGLTKTGAGTLTLTSSNSYGGLTTVSAGVLNVQNSAALGTPAAGTTISSGAVLQLQGGFDVVGETLSLNGTGLSTSGAFRNISGSNSWSGAITLAGSTTIDAPVGTLYLGANISNATFTTTLTNNGTLILGGVIGGGTGGVTKVGTGTAVVNGANTYTGATTVSGGILQFGATGSLPAVSAVTVNTNATLDLNGFNESLLSLAGAGNVTLGGGTLTVSNSASVTLSGVLSGPGGLAKLNTGVWTLSGVNTFTGNTVINGGAISIAKDSNLGGPGGNLTLNGGTLTTGATMGSARLITLGAGGGTFNLGGDTTLSNTISGPGALMKLGSKNLILLAPNTYLGGTTVGAGTITVNTDSELGDAAGAVTFSNATTLATTASFTSARNFVLNPGTATYSAGTGFTNTLTGVISGAGAFTKAGAGVLLLGGNNTFTNILTISAGTLRLGGNERLADLTPVLVTSTSAILDLNNFTETIGSLASTAAGKVTLGNGFLTAGGNNLSTTNSSVISGNGGFTKAGTGTMIFTGANTYTNTTTITAGVLELGASERIANTSPLVINSGATFNLTWGGTNYNETVATLAGAGNVILGGGTLTLGNPGTTTFSGGISGTGAVTKVGAGTQIFSGTNSFSGATTVSVGTLQVNGSDASSAVTIASAATLSGGGTVGTVAVNSGATNSPGANAPGTLSSGSQTWAGGGNYLWEINNATGAKGGSSGWDWLNISGTLTITANSGSKFNLKLASLTVGNAAGQVANFDNTVTYIWTIASASGGISGFNAGSFNIITNGFQNPLGAGTFALSQSGNDLNLIFTTAAAAVVNNVQSGTLISTGNGTNTVTLGAGVNLTNAFLVFSTRHNSSVPGGSMIRGRLASTNTVEFVRATTETSTMNIQWYVAEYSAGVKVQRGEVSQTNTTINLSLSPLSATNQAFVLWSKTPDPTETAFTDSDPVVGEITSVSNLQFRVTAAPSSVPKISWQVVEFTHPASINVQKGIITNLTGTNLLATAALNLTVDPNATFLLTGYRTAGAGTSVGARMLRAQLTATTVTVDRSIAGAPDDISEIVWQAVQLKDGSLVQSGSANLPGGSAQTNINLNISLNTSRTIAFASVQPAGGQNTGRSPSTGNVLGVGSATLGMASSVQLTLDRNNTSDQADIAWSVVGLGPSAILAPAVGGVTISADTKGGAYTSLSGPNYTEIQSGNVSAGTIILKTPTGFIFDTNAALPTVLVTRVGGSGADALNINGVASGTSVAMTTVTTTNLTLTITAPSSGGVTCSLTWQNVRVRPLAGTPLATGNLTAAGTAVVQGVTTNSTSWGFLNEVVGAANKLALATAPSATAVAGVDFGQQPVIQIQDQFGNLRNADAATVVTVTNNGAALLNGTTNVTAIGGVATFSGLDYQLAATIKLGFAASGLVGTNSGNIVVSPAPASQLTLSTQPAATATAGASFTRQPVVRIEDSFGNLRSTDSSTIVTASINQGSDNLFGTLTAKAVNGVATFTNLSYQTAETITIDFTSGGLDLDTSAAVTVNPAAASQLVIQTQPASVATAGAPFAPQPVIQIQDPYGNVCVTNNSTVVTAARNAGGGAGTLQGVLTATASGGVVTFTGLAHNVAGTISVDFSSGALSGATSGSILVNPGAASRLAFSTQPGAANVGTVFGTQPVLVTQDAYGNASVAGLGNNVRVALALTSGAGALRGATNLDIGINVGNGAVAFTDLQIDSAGSKQLTASASGLTSAISSGFTVGQGTQSIAFNSPGDQTYGVAPITLGATVGSGLAVTYTVTSGPATVSSNLLTLTGAGAVTVQAAQAGTADWLAATPVNQTISVAPKSVTGSVTVSNKIYDRTVAASIATRTLSGVINSDAVSLTSGPATFADKNVGTGKVVTITGLSLTGTNASNYVLASTNAVTTANITAAVLTVSATGVSKVYDRTTAATVTLADNRISGDSLTTSYGSATFADKNAGDGKTVSVSGISVTGADAGNYTFNSTASTPANITPATLTVSATGVDKVYDGTPTATVTLSDNRISGDVLTNNYGSATFADKNVGNGKTVSVSGISVTGPDAANYTFNSTTTTTANITSALLTVTADNQSRAYAAANPVLTVRYSGFASGDDTNGLAGSPNLSTTATTGSAAGSYPITVTAGSLSATNYQFAFVNGTLSVGKATLTVRADDQMRAYGDTNPVFTVSYTGFLNGDDTNVLVGAAELGADADTNSPVAGSPYIIRVTNGTLSAANYDFAFTSGQLTITQAVLTVTADDLSKTYGAAVPALTASYSGFVNGEDASVLAGSPDLSTIANASSPVAGSPYEIVVTNGTLSASNYTFAFFDGTLIVNPATISSSITASDKIYDGNNVAGIATRKLSGVFGSDDVTLIADSATFDDKNVGPNKTVTAADLSLAGGDAGNYVLAAPTATTTASIAARALTVGATGADKVYDGTSAATVSLSDDRVAGDVLTSSYASASFADKHVANNKAVGVSGINVSGDDANNYTFNSTAVTTASISASPITVTAATNTKNYDGTTSAAATPTITAGSVQNGDTANFSETYDTSSVGTNKTLTPGGTVDDGNSGHNYSYAFVSDYSGIINPRAPSLSVPANQFITELTTLVVTNVASEAGLSADHLRFSLVSAPTNMTLDAVSGIITWTPTEAQGPSINNVVVRVTDDRTPALTDTRSFTVFVNESNAAPILTVPADQVVPLSGSLAVTATATDADIPANALTFSLVAAPSGMHINGTSGLITWTPTTAQRPSTNLVTVRVTDNGGPALSDTESFVVRAAAPDDVTAPVVTIAAPLANFRTPADMLTVTGVARDNRAVASVLFSVNGGGFIPATGTTNWSALIPLAAGTNTVAVKGVDGSGNVSLPVTRSFYRTINAVLTVNIAGAGLVNPSLNGAVLEVNQAYTLTATPSTYNLFTNWDGGVTGTNRVLRFVMQSNLIITANFITNRLVPLAGTYNGLFSDTNGATQESAGFFTLKSTPLGAFSGKVSVGGGTYSMSGAFDPNGHVSATVPRLGKTALTVELQLELDSSSDHITGKVGCADWTASLLGDRSVFNATANPASAFVSKYTMQVPSTPGVTNAPMGNGYGLISVGAGGAVTLAGALADGVRIAQAVTLSKTGEWPLYVPLYSGPFVYTNNLAVVVTSKQFYGSLIGWVTFTSNSVPTLNGLLVCIKKPLAAQAYYPAGFTNQTDLLGSAYTPPPVATSALNLTNAEIQIQNGDLLAPIKSGLALQANNTISVAAPNLYGIKLVLSKQNGLLKGAFISPVTGTTKNIAGAVLQNSNVAGGFFLGPNSAGLFKLQNNQGN